jgi:hypothetical protein
LYKIQGTSTVFRVVCDDGEGPVTGRFSEITDGRDS